MNTHAQALGRLAAGRPKNYSKAERERRRKRLAEARKKRWNKLVVNCPCGKPGEIEEVNPLGVVVRYSCASCYQSAITTTSSDTSPQPAAVSVRGSTRTRRGPASTDPK